MCEANHKGSAGKMKVDEAIEMFSCANGVLPISIMWKKTIRPSELLLKNGHSFKNLVDGKIKKIDWKRQINR